MKRGCVFVFWTFCIIILLAVEFINAKSDYYELLGVTRAADNREIRKAFKQLALRLHPDKNDAPDAHEKFLELNKAYETLKDEEKRKKYDLYGEDGLDDSERHSKYQSWKYYKDDFGIYDDDPEIITLDSAEFQRSVLESHDIWFINFYSPRCGHCHDLAPTWRQLARSLQGVVRVGAVNCAEDNWLCQRQGIRGYPSLMLYSMEGSSKYTGPKEKDEIMTFLLRHLHDPVIDIWEGNFKQWTLVDPSTGSKPWLFLFCTETCPDTETRILVGSSLQGLVNIGLVDCKQDAEVCHKLRGNREADIIYFKDMLESSVGIELDVSIDDHIQVSNAVLSLLPGPTHLDADAIRELEVRLSQDLGPGWIILFTNKAEGSSLEYSKINYLVPRLRFGRVDCSKEASVCSKYSVHKYPTFAVFKLGGGYEVHYGRNGVQDVATFARISTQARTMRTLSAADFPAILNDNNHVFVDFFAPWCPPCMQMLPEFRKASNQIGGSIVFGTVDCTIHRKICDKYQIRGYPTTIFFNNTEQHHYNGQHSADSMAGFVHDILRPSVISLDRDSFNIMVGRKSGEEMWLVDFYAPWCGPCQQLEPVWAELGRKFDKQENIKFGKVDCQKNSEFCGSQSIRGYPSIRLYPLRSEGSRIFQKYEGYHRDVSSLYTWIQQSIPSNVISLTPHTFQHQVLGTRSPWLVMFAAPWCSHCVRFTPEYQQIAAQLENKIKVAKVNCEKYKQLCSQASVTGYPTIRIYRGSDKAYTQDYFSQDIDTTDVDRIMLLVEEHLKLFESEDAKEEKEKYNHDEL